MAVVEVRGLVARYGTGGRAVTAVDGVDLEVERGEVLALLGPNGAGKTTTLACIEGHRAADDGHVRVLGLDPVADGPALRRRVGVLPQGFGLYPHVRVGEAVRTFAAFHADPEDPDALLAALDLERLARARVRTLSGGERQRLGLALALVGRPELLLLDEPTAGLDPVARRRTWELLRARTAAGATVLVTTHLLDEAADVADRVAVIDRGRLRALGTAAELTGGDAARTRLRLGPAEVAAPVAAAVAAALADALGVAATTDASGTVEVAVPADARLLAALAPVLAAHGAVVVDLRAGARSLEEVYLRLVDADAGAA
ncbi:MAG: ABC transporter ATP-binding protein [Nitriliruptoraceae bacterium]